MDVIRQANNDIISFLGGSQKRIKDKTYRLNKYCMEIKLEDGTLLYNGLTGGLVLIRPLEWINIYTTYPCDYANHLLETYFLVPENFNEDELIEAFRAHKQKFISDNYLDVPTHYTILTTSKCNARCFYCYENGVKHKKNMTLETAEKIAKYIIDRGVDVTLDWFGGEPLVNYEVIDLIVSRLTSAGIKYHSTMISNGFLFTPELVQKAKYQWKLSSIQITLDGTEEVYNKSKNYIKPDVESPFKKVIQNIKLLTQYEIRVSVRLNADTYNIDNLTELVEELYKEFRGNRFFSMYSHEIFEINGYKRSEEDSKILYEKLLALDRNLISKGFLFPKTNMGIKALHCKVDSESGIVITPDGSIGLCEHYINDRFISHIDTPNDKNFEEIKSWRRYYSQDYEICKNCVLRPGCLKVIDCPDAKVCDENEQKYHLEYFKTDLLEITHEHYNRQNNKKQCNLKNHGSC